MESRPASCFLLPASCFLLPASCFLLPASCFLLLKQFPVQDILQMSHGPPSWSVAFLPFRKCPKNLIRNLFFQPNTKAMNQFKLRKEIAAEYDISVKVLNIRIALAGLDIPPRRRISPKDCERIYEALGRPFPPSKG